MRALVGTSGYSYKEWKGPFYPENLPAGRMLEYYAGRFGAVEINNTFYRMPDPELLTQWTEKVPDHFLFAIKANRRITHLKRLKEVDEPVRYLFDAIARLGDKLGSVLFQLPPHQKKDLDRLQRFLDLLAPSPRVAMEFRNISWFDDEVYSALQARNVAVCVADAELKGGAVPFVATADWGYLRLRGVEYDDEVLLGWVERVRGQEWDRAFVFFKHEDQGTGPLLADRFSALFDSADAPT